MSSRTERATASWAIASLAGRPRAELATASLAGRATASWATASLAGRALAELAGLVVVKLLLELAASECLSPLVAAFYICDLILNYKDVNQV